ncbi:MAG: hypothetical protein BGO14_06720 [Chlamydiales bacterium 38-26]|nr:hypothetical protein [Chlamydiales bacterium]OJV08569.1 MAG: hypothetical protein BGO14_06720 [Chlamydiales bacterium 38-26]
MNISERLGFYSKSLFNGDCLNNFRYNNTLDSKEIVIAKVVSAAIIAGIISVIFISFLAPFTVVFVGLGAFVYHTAEGLQPPSQEFVENVIKKIPAAPSPPLEAPATLNPHRPETTSTSSETQAPPPSLKDRLSNYLPKFF